LWSTMTIHTTVKTTSIALDEPLVPEDPEQPTHSLLLRTARMLQI